MATCSEVEGSRLACGTPSSLFSEHRFVLDSGQWCVFSFSSPLNLFMVPSFGLLFSCMAVYSRITRESIDALKSHFKDELSNDDWRLVIDLKKVFGIL